MSIETEDQRCRSRGAISKYLAKAPVGLGLLLFVLFAQRAVPAECGSTAYDCALYYVHHEECASAFRSLEPVLKREPCNLNALNLMRTAEARKDFEQVLKHAPEDETANLWLAKTDSAEENCGSALAYFEKAQKQVVNSPELILHYGGCALEAGQRKAAITILDRLPLGDAQAQFRAGVLLARKGTYREAAKHFARAQQEGFHDLSAAEYDQVLMLVKAGDYPSAIRVATAFISEGHKQADLDSLVAEAYLKEGQVAEAYDWLRRATQLEPAQVGNYLDLAAICVQYSKYDLGLRIVNVGLHYNPNSYRLLVERGVMRVMKGELAQAEPDFMQATKLAPRKSLPYVALGNLWIEMGKNKKAVDLFRARAKSSPENFMVEYLLGEALVRAGMTSDSSSEREAIEAFETSIRLNPNYVEPRIQLGKLLLRRGEVDGAIVELKKAAVLDPTDVGPVVLLAEAYRRKGNMARAEELAARVNKLQTEKDEGIVDKAKARFRQILRDSISTFSSEHADQ